MREPRRADPRRFALRPRLSRPMALVLGLSLLLGALLAAAPRGSAGLAAAVVLGGAWLSLVLAMTLPRESERAGQELTRRLAHFRHELTALGDAPTKGALERLIRLGSELGLRDDEIGAEIAELRACLEALELRTRLARGELPTASPPEPLSAGDVCHFACPVRFGRRRADQFGHLVLSRSWLTFNGALDVSVSWSEVASVGRHGRDIVVALQDSHRVLRFACHSAAEAARGGVVAEHLAKVARAPTAQANVGPHLAL